MRKLYSILAGLFIVLASSNIQAQTITPDVANFTFTVHTGNNVSFTNTSVLGNVLGERRAWWHFGDGSSQSSPALGNMQHHYNVAGTYTVCLKIYLYSNSGHDSTLTASICKTVVLENLCGANYEYQVLSTGTTPGVRVVNFTAIPSHSQNSPVMEVCWNFGDGTPIVCRQASTSVPPTNLLQIQHTFTSAGPYNVCVTIKYQGGCIAEKCRTIQLPNIPPDSCRANFERINVSATANPLHASFKALPWHSNNKKPVLICWDFGDGQDTCIQYSNTYTGPYTVNHTYSTMGLYNVCVKIRYEGGCEKRKCDEIRISHPPATCSVNLHELTQSVNSLTRGFLAVPQSNPPRRPELVCWNFGDGTDTCITIDPTQPIPNLAITHTYPGPGVYHACVRVKFQGGCVAEKCKEVVIRPAANVCGGYMVDSLSGPRTFKFRGFSIHSPGDEVLSYHWSFGDGTSAMGQTVTHTYNVAGLYEVCLKIKTRLGCETRICKTLRVPGNNNQPVLVITPNPVIHQMHATFFSTHTQTVNIKIINQFGIVVRTYTRSAVTGSNTWGFDLSTLMPGIYTFTVQSPNQLASVVFIKL